MFNFLNNIGPTELIIIVLILLVFFGAKIITSLARTGGSTVREMKNIKKEFTKTLEDDGKEVAKK